MEWLKYNTASQQLFTVLLALNSRSAQSNPTLATGDVTVSKDGGAFANIATLADVLPASGVQVRIQLSAAELSCKILTIRFADQTVPAQWDEQYVQVCTYGNASAFLVFDMSQATPAVNTTQLAGQAVTAAAGVTFPTSVASPTNITAGTITTVTNLTNERAKYMGGAVWISASGAAGTVSYTNGIITNPVTGIADAKTIADNLLMKKFYTQAGTTVTLVATMDSYVFDGWAWKLALGGRNISNSVFMNCINVTGVSSSSSATSFPYFIDCEFGATATVPPSNNKNCSYGGTVTLVGSGNYDFVDCTSVVAGTSTPIFDVNSVAAVNISFRRWSGGITINNIVADTVISIDVVSGGTVTLNGVGGNVQVRGMTAGIVDNRTGSPTLGQNAALNRTTLATPTNITAGTITTVSGNVTGSVGSVATAVDSNLVSIDGQATAGNNATLNLKKLNIVNSTGDAIVAQATGSNGIGIKVTGFEDGEAVKLQGGDNASAFWAKGGLTAATGSVEIVGNNVAGIRAIATVNDTDGIYASGYATGSGMRLYGGQTGPAMNLVGGATSGQGLNIESALGKGVTITATGIGVDLVSSMDKGIKVRSADNSIDVLSSGSQGIRIVGYTNGVDISSVDETGLKISGQSYGIDIRGVLQDGVRITADEKSGIDVIGYTNGVLVSGATIDGIKVSGAVNGMSLLGTTGDDLAGITPSTNFVMSVSGTADANLVSIDGQLTVGNNATLNLKKLSIVNTVDAAVEITSSATGYGIEITGIDGGIKINGTGGHGIDVSGITYGLYCEGVDTDAGAYGAAFVGSGIGHGVTIIHTGSGGNALNLSSALGIGINITAGGRGISAVSSGDAGIYAVGTGFGVQVRSTAGTGFNISGEYGINVEGTQYSAIKASAIGANGSGLELHSGTVTGFGIDATGTFGAVLTGTQGDGLVAQSTGGNGNGINAIGLADGITARSANDGNGIRAAGAGNGSGMSLVKAGAGTGHDLTFETPDCTIPVTTDVTNMVDANTIQIDSATDPAQKLSISASTMATGTVDDTAFAPTTTEFETSDITVAGTDFFKTRTLIVVDGTLDQQARIITGYSVIGGRGHFTVKALTAPLVNGVGFIIV
jgi:hypothetical protein